jgi:hypothetical protein
MKNWKKSLLCFVAVTLASLCLNFVKGAAGQRKQRNFIMNSTPDKTITDCAQITIQSDGWQVVRSEQERAIPKSAVSSLEVQAPRYGGINVSGWDRDQYSIKACLGAAGESAAEARRLLARLVLVAQDGRVTVTGPRGDTWMGYLIIRAPRGATMRLKAMHAAIVINSITGNIESRNQDGSLSLHNVDGQIRAEVMNGPISVSGGRGEYRLHAQNGPLTVELLGSRWESGELEGRAQNGPLVLMLPPDYKSAVRVDTSKHSPVECRAAQCKGAARTPDKPYLIEFGGPNPLVKLSTVNGSTTVMSSNAKPPGYSGR